MIPWRAWVKFSIGSFQLDVDISGKNPIALIGPNGAGKSVFLRLLLGVYKPKGEIEINGQTVFSSNQNINLEIEKRKIGFVSQGYSLFPHLSVLDNVAFGIRFTRNRKDSHEIAMEILEYLSCEHLAYRNPNTLSGGESQKIALARALAIKPQLLLLDEPFSALDVVTRKKTRTFLFELLNHLKLSAIITSHSLRDVVAMHSQIYVLENGKISQSGHLQELQNKPKTPFIQEFFEPMLAGIKK